jgi:hypothetical protein
MSVTTPRKRAANRANAAKSTGPTTPEGKQRASRNAVIHGLFCRSAVLPGEDAARLRRLRQGMMDRLRPRDELERALADRVVCETWRLRRAVAFEGRVITSKTAEDLADRRHYTALYSHKPPLEAGQVILDLLREDVLTKLSRYEQRIERSVYRAMAELRRLQKRSLPEGQWIDPEEEEAQEQTAPEQEQMRETKPTAENSDNGGLRPEEEEDYEDEDERTDEDERGRETKPTGENSENGRLTEAEEDEEEQDYEEEEEATNENVDERARRTKPDAENSENDGPLAEEDEEEEDYEDEDERGRQTKPTGENSENGEPPAVGEDEDEDERARETKPKPDYSRVMLAVPRSEPPAPARARRRGRF